MKKSRALGVSAAIAVATPVWAEPSLVELAAPSPSASPVEVASPPPARPDTVATTDRSPPPVAPCADVDTDGEVRTSTGCSGVFGIRGSVTAVHGVDATTGTGLMFSSEGEELVKRGVFSLHASHRLGIGGGGAGFEGTLLGGLAGGFRIPFGEHHGPVFRAGAFGYVRGNDGFYASLLELPRVEIGYQYWLGTTVLELGATSGAVLTGRYRAGDSDTRSLGGGLEVGGYVAVHVPWVRLGASAVRLPARDDLSSPVRTAEGTLCVLSAPFAICADARATVADAVTLSGVQVSDVRSLYSGLAFGLTGDH